MEIRLFKIGDDFIISQIGDGAGTGNVKLVRPVYLVMTPDGLLPVDVLSGLSDDKEFLIPRSKILLEMTPKREIKEAYERTISPITVVTKKLIV